MLKPSIPPPRERRARRLALAFLRVSVVLAAVAAVFVGLVKSDVLPNPFDPSLAGDVELARSGRPGLRVLFVGNSLTFSNSMPKLVGELADRDPGAPPLYAVWYTKGGWTLREASEDDGLAELLDDVNWNWVVLQEQSQLLSFPPSEWGRETAPYARRLDDAVEAAGARTLLFMTWAHEAGDDRNHPDDTFEAMQQRLAAGYEALGEELGDPVAPVGLAWREATRRRGIGVWADDGRHPSLAGSYLAACVLYAALTGRDPRVSTFTGGLDPAEARFLRDVAAAVVGV